MRLAGVLSASIALGVLLLVGVSIDRSRARAVLAPSRVYVFYVSARGSDRNPGTRERPFRSLVRARDAVRGVNGRAARDIEVRLLGGIYRLRSPLRLGAHDSGSPGHPVVWSAEPGQTAIISGGLRVRGWRLFDRGGGIWRARVPRVNSRQLYVDGRREPRARSAGPPPGMLKTATGYEAPSVEHGVVFHAGMEIVSNWGWKSFRCPVGSVRRRVRVTQLAMAQPCWHNANVFAPLFRMNAPSWVENSYQLVDRPGEWYLDHLRGWLYLKSPRSLNLARADVELPLAQALLVADGTRGDPIHDLRFERLTFSYATWLVPSTGVGYADDQTGLRVVDPHQLPAGSHAENTTPIPGNVRLGYARGVAFSGDHFTHLGAAGLQFDTGSQDDEITGNRFDDISAAAIVLGGVALRDHHPRFADEITRDNEVFDNVVAGVAREYPDSAGIFVGFTTRSLIAHNDLYDLPYDGISVGWGFGMMDPGRIPGVRGHFPGCFGCQNLPWPEYRTPTTSRGNRVLYNRIWNYLQTLYDGGAIYVLGQQGRSARDGMMIAGNVAFDKAPQHGGNVLYTDAGTRYVTISGNATYDNTPGYYGSSPPYSKIPWGRDGGGCRPRSEIRWQHNWWQYPDVGYPQPQLICHPRYCPVDVAFIGNRLIRRLGDIPPALRARAGVQGHGRTPVAYPPVAGAPSPPANPPPSPADCPHWPS